MIAAPALVRSLRRGSSQTAVLVMLGSVVVLLAMFALLAWPTKQPGVPVGNHANIPLLVHVAASNKSVVQKIADQFTRETGVPVQLQFGASQTLLAGIEVSQTGDIFLPADESYLTQAAEKGFTREVFPLAKMTAVVVVAKDNPHNVKSFDDLLREDFRLVQGSVEATAIGNLTLRALAAENRWEPLAKRTIAFKTTVNDAANDVKIGAADAALVWDAVAKQYPDLTMIELPELKPIQATVAAAVLSTSAQPTAALRFARYLAASDRGLAEYQQAGFSTVTGDPWEAVPEIVLFAGSMLRPAIETTITEF